MVSLSSNTDRLLSRMDPLQAILTCIDLSLMCPTTTTTTTTATNNNNNNNNSNEMWSYFTDKVNTYVTEFEFPTTTTKLLRVDIQEIHLFTSLFDQLKYHYHQLSSSE